MSNSVLIPWKLFSDLVAYHLGGLDDPDLAEAIRAGLAEKLNAVAARETYAEQLRLRSMAKNTDP